MKNLVINLLALLTFLSDIFILLILLMFLAKKFTKKLLFNRLRQPIILHSYHLAFLVALTATLGSLFYSEIMKFTPCRLCWYQRIFMYPQVILLYVAIMKNERVIKPYLITLNSIGAIVSAYHYLLQRFPKMLLPTCGTQNLVPCNINYTFHYGYITIPMMALSAFLLIILLLKLSE